ncbi:uncharacterized protein CG45076-like [Drosophila serrata]|uniref:uncharacterized protein CG45076-like n=1 Tax=Drosophila serrata TaxID=7274 RepID=UPI000A1CFC12|nr:uncharacterized protein CG45076-like [Drosophila serrata]
MEILRLVLFIISITLVFGDGWQTMPIADADDYNGLVSDNQGPSGGNCQDDRCPTMVRPKPNSFAQKAAKAAKEASDAQVEAGAAAARQVQRLLAEKAACAAKAAEAACVGKQQLVEQIESELREGRLVVQKERARLQFTKATAADARQGVNQVVEEIKSLTEVIKKAQEGVTRAESVIAGSQKAVAEQKQAVAEAKGRLQLLIRQAEVARADYKSTKTAVEKAASAAQEARQRAGRERRMSGTTEDMPTYQGTFYMDKTPGEGYSPN